MTVNGFDSNMFLYMCIFNSHNICILKIVMFFFLIVTERCLLF